MEGTDDQELKAAVRFVSNLLGLREFNRCRDRIVGALVSLRNPCWYGPVCIQSDPFQGIKASP